MMVLLLLLANSGHLVVSGGGVGLKWRRRLLLTIFELRSIVVVSGVGVVIMNGIFI